MEKSQNVGTKNAFMPKIKGVNSMPLWCVGDNGIKE